jgi:hypothetical protein
MSHSPRQKADTSAAAKSSAAPRQMARTAAFEDLRPQTAAQLKLQEAADHSGQVKQLKTISALTAGNAPVRQFKVAMKGQGKARRADGDMASLQAEVNATIARADYAEVLADIANLSRSITSRTDDNGNFTPHTPDWESHRARIVDEKACRALLYAEKARLESLKKKPAKEVTASASSNPFALLGGGADEDDSGSED